MGFSFLNSKKGWFRYICNDGISELVLHCHDGRATFDSKMNAGDFKELEYCFLEGTYHGDDVDLVWENKREY